MRHLVAGVAVAAARGAARGGGGGGPRVPPGAGQ